MQRYKIIFTYASAHVRKIVGNASNRLKTPSPAISRISDPLSIFIAHPLYLPVFLLFSSYFLSLNRPNFGLNLRV